MISAVEDVARACLFTSLTTIAAFLSFAASGIASFAQFGIAASWGVLSALFVTFSVVPVVLVQVSSSSLGSPQTQESWDALTDFILVAIRTQKKSILGISALLTILSAVGLASLRIDIRPEQLMGEENQVTRWSRWVRKNLREIESLEIGLLVPDGTSHRDSEVIEAVGNLCQWLNAGVAGVSNAKSINDLIDASSGGVRAMRRGALPQELGTHRLSERESPETVSGAALINNWVNRSDASRGERGAETLRVSAEARSMSTRDQERLIRAVKEYLNGALPAKWKYYLAGSIPIYLEMMKSLQRYQILCFVLASISSLVLMSILLQSVRVSILGLLPSFLPAIVALGMLGWWGWGLDPASTMVATIILGVAVDDTIHLLNGIQRELRKGASLVDAVCVSIRNLGRAVIVSSLVLAAAFWTLTTSPSSSVAIFGFLAGVSILIALVADLFILPCLILGIPGCSAPRTQSDAVRAMS
jgi:predicted RND superfamily exporter protein